VFGLTKRGIVSEDDEVIDRIDIHLVHKEHKWAMDGQLGHRCRVCRLFLQYPIGSDEFKSPCPGKKKS
jgi:hypothetical protein